MEELAPHTIEKGKIEYISGSTVFNFTVHFYWYPSQGLPKHIKMKVLSTCFYLISSFYRKIKRSLEVASLSSHILHNIWRKIYLMLYPINWRNLTVWLLLLHKICNSGITVIGFPVDDIINFEIICRI